MRHTPLISAVWCESYTVRSSVKQIYIYLSANNSYLRSEWTDGQGDLGATLFAYRTWQMPCGAFEGYISDTMCSVYMISLHCDVYAYNCNRYSSTYSEPLKLSSRESCWRFLHDLSIWIYMFRSSFVEPMTNLQSPYSVSCQSSRILCVWTI